MVMAVTGPTVGSRLRRKWGIVNGRHATQSPDHVHEHVIELNSQPVLTQHLEGHVSISDVPGDAREFHRVAAGNVRHRFRGCPYLDDFTVVQNQAVAVGQSSGSCQIEQERCAPIVIETYPPAMPVSMREGDAGDWRAIAKVGGTQD